MDLLLHEPRNSSTAVVTDVSWRVCQQPEVRVCKDQMQDEQHHQDTLSTELLTELTVPLIVGHL